MEPQQECFYSHLFSLPGLDNKQQEDKVQPSVYLAHTGDCRLGTGWPEQADISLSPGLTAVEANLDSSQRKLRTHTHTRRLHTHHACMHSVKFTPITFSGCHFRAWHTPAAPSSL